MKKITAFIICLVLISHPIFAMSIPSSAPEQKQEIDSEIGGDIEKAPAWMAPVAITGSAIITMGGIMMLTDDDDSNDKWGYAAIFPATAMLITFIVYEIGN